MADPVVPVDTDNTSLSHAQELVKAGTVAQCAQLNANLKANYLAGFANWKLNVDAGRIDNTNPPKPPKSYIPVEAPPADDGSMGSGWFFPVQAGPPVCEIPPIPESMVSPKPTLDGSVTVIGVNVGGAFYSCPATDTNKPGTVKQIPAADGTIHKFILLGSPWGRIWEDQGV